MVRHEEDVESIPVEMEGAQNVIKQVLVAPEDGYEGFMRMFTIAQGGNTPYHHHDWYHLNYVIEGEGIVTVNEKEYPLSKGSVAYIPGGTEHGFKNTGAGELRFLCLIPPEGSSR
jgi:quercetin dioxygenase-like cupin family protein